MKTRHFLWIFIVVVIAACAKEDIPVIDDPDPLPENAINLSDLKEGQKSFFIKYTSTCDSLEEKFEYTRDTLVVEVVKQNGELFLKEYLTENSPMYQDTFSSNEPVFYPVRGIENNVLIPERAYSSLFYFYGNDTIRLNRQHDVNLLQSGCKLMIESNPFIGDEIGVVQNFRFGGVEVKNKTVVSCVPMVDIDAYLIYNNEQLFLSHTVTIVEFMGFIQEFIAGWELLEP
jgi:hypothetical protein